MSELARVVYDGPAKKLYLYDHNGDLFFECPARNDSAADDAWRADAGLEPGTYTLEAPEKNDPPTEESGFWTCHIADAPVAASIHGGGAGLAYPYNAHQGWEEAGNCIRLQNDDLAVFVKRFPHVGAPLPLEIIQSEDVVTATAAGKEPWD